MLQTFNTNISQFSPYENKASVLKIALSVSFLNANVLVGHLFKNEIVYLVMQSGLTFFVRSIASIIRYV